MNIRRVLVICTMLFIAFAFFQVGGPAKVYHAAERHHDNVERARVVAAQPRKVYGYSVIPGGVLDGADLAKHIGIDPALAVWLGTCGEPVQYGVLDNDIDVFTTFRRDASIRWSTKRIHVKAGESYLKRCGRTILTRCGNEISWTPQIPSAPVEPGILESTNPIPTPPLKLDSPQSTSTETHTSVPPAGGTPSTSSYPCCGGTFFPPPGGPGTPPVHVPEPSTWILIVGGFAAAGIWWAIVRTRKNLCDRYQPDGCRYHSSPEPEIDPETGKPYPDMNQNAR